MDGKREYESSPMKSICSSKKKCNLGGELGGQIGRKKSKYVS